MSSGSRLRKELAPPHKSATGVIGRFVPSIGWLARYNRADALGDLSAGIIVAIMLVPQAMAYAMLAGLPPEVGLYASMAPPIIYAIFGSSRTLAVGPVAVASLMVAAALGNYVAQGPAAYLEGAFIISLEVGLILFALGLTRAGFVANYLSHPVMSGFTSAAALIIALSQVKHLLGLTMPGNLDFGHTLYAIASSIGTINGMTAILGLAAVVLLFLVRSKLAGVLKRLGLPGGLAAALARTGPLFVVVIATALVGGLGLHDNQDVAVVGTIPAGLPPIGVPSLDPALWGDLALSSLAIALVSFVESVAIAKVLAAKRRERIEANQELIGLGLANVAGAFTGASAVCGGFARSAVNFQSGARTQMAAVITAILVGASTLALAPLFAHLPQAVLAAIIVVSVIGLFEPRSFVRNFRYSKADGVAQGVTFLAVLGLGIEIGILAGIALSILFHLWRTSRPHIAIVGRVGNTEHFRNVLRHRVTINSNLLLLRVDESLYFPNVAFIEERVLAAIAERPGIKHFVLICSSINVIDASALETLDEMRRTLRDFGVEFHLTEVKGPVMDKLERAGFIERLGHDHVHLSTNDAVVRLSEPTGNTEVGPNLASLGRRNSLH